MYGPYRFSQSSNVCQQVFEFLRNLGLKDFGIDNWRSKMRHHAKAHERYEKIMPWTNPETADIVYPDIDSRLTSLFCDAGYLDEATWESATPTYYLEVKTAVGKCDERLFMSNKQYEMVCAAGCSV